MLTVTPVAAAVDQGPEYGRVFGEIYDRVFPRDARADDTAAFLRDLAPGHGAVFVEQGVGSGRIAIPLAALGGTVVGIDSSPDLLQQAGRAAAAAHVTVGLERADIRTRVLPGPADVVYCVCATLSMLPTRSAQEATVGSAARMLRPGGALVVETHSPTHVRAVHAGRRTAVFDVPVAGLDGGLRMTATLDADRWSVVHRWTTAGRAREMSEESLLIGPDELDIIAADNGLTPTGRFGSWDRTTPADAGASYVAVYRTSPPTTSENPTPTRRKSP